MVPPTILAKAAAVAAARRQASTSQEDPMKVIGAQVSISLDLQV